jgi:hypothetical protein
MARPKKQDKFEDIKNPKKFEEEYSNSEKIYNELEILRQKNNGILEAGDVVNAARNKDNILHPYFEWNDSLAGELYRLKQAGNIIRACVAVDEVTKEKTRVYVSLSEGGNNRVGYRAIVDVLADDGLKQQLLEQALKELYHFKNKYRVLEKFSEMKPIFNEIEFLLGK